MRTLSRCIEEKQYYLKRSFTFLVALLLMVCFLGTANSQTHSDSSIGNSLPGHGTLNFKDGSYFVGKWKNGKVSGHGTFYYSNGDRYEGNWKNGKRDGQGTYYWADGRYYVGEFNKGKPSDTGVHYTSDNEENVHWSGGQQSGKGVLENTNGRRVEVKWVES